MTTPIRFPIGRLVAFAAASTLWTVAARAELAGEYRGAKISVQLTAAVDGSFSGEIDLGDKRFPLKASKIDDGHLAGSFEASGHAFAFSASVDGDVLTLTSDKQVYTATRAGPVNPLAGDGASAAPAAAQSNDGAFAIVLSTAAGKSLAGEKPEARTIKEAIVSTVGDLQKMFPQSVNIQSAYEDSREHQSSLISFTCSDHGTPLRGIASFKQQQQGVSVGIVYCRADAPPSDWKALTDAGQVPADAAAASIALRPYNFPDGTGSIGLADGWSCNAPTASDTVILSGPADQHVELGGTWLVNASDSPIMKIYRGNVARARQLRMSPPPAPTLLTAEFSPPIEALQTLLPQINEMNRRQGSNISTSDIQIIARQDCRPLNPQGKAVRTCYTYMRDIGGTKTRRRSVVEFESDPLGQGEWMLYWAVELSAPDETFDRDQPAMAAMANSLKINSTAMSQVVQGKMQAQDIAFQNAQKQRADAYDEQHRQQIAGYDAHNKQWREDMNEKGRRNADFVEMIRGYRTVVDTKTGEATSADYYNVDGIVSALNTNDPGRYVEIPLRDELYPKSGVR